MKTNFASFHCSHYLIQFESELVGLFCHKRNKEEDMSQKNKTVESDTDGWIRVYPSLHEYKGNSKIKHLLRILKRLKKDIDMPVQLIYSLRLILENTHNAFTFHQRSHCMYFPAWTTC
jgi:hypothetical protein